MTQPAELKNLRNEVQLALAGQDWSRGAELMGLWCGQRPDDARGWYYRSYFCMKLGQVQEAAAAVTRSLNLDSGQPDAQKLFNFITDQMKAQTRKAGGAEGLWHPGSVVDGRYEVKGSKRGGMGEVYFAYDRELEHMVAIKAPLASVLESEAKKARFYREAEAWMGLGMHPNICSAYYVQEISGIPWLFIEYVGGGTLDDWLKKKELTFLEKLDIALQLTSGMNHTHSFHWVDDDGNKHKGLVHRDLKPANILMRGDGTPKVTDFGLVGFVKDGSQKDISENDRDAIAHEENLPLGQTLDREIKSDVHLETLTMAGMAVGTPPYMAPEQWRAAHDAGFPADVYAYGCILYYIFCGCRPFSLPQEYRNAMPAHKMYLWEKMHTEELPPDPISLSPDLNRTMADMMLQCLDKAPDRRPANFADIREVLKGIYAEAAKRPYPRPEPRASRLLADSLNNHGVSFLTIGHTRRAENCWREALRTDPHHIEASFNMALHQWKNNEITFEEVYRRMEEVGRTHLKIWRQRQLTGRMYQFFGDYSRAVESFRQAVQEPDVGIKVWRDLGLALAAEAGPSDDQALWAEAESCFQKVLDHQYEDPEMATGYALALRRLGRKERAESYYREARSRHADLPNALDEAIHLFLSGQEIIDSIEHHGWVNSLDFSRDGRRVYCGSDTRLSVWEIKGDSPDFTGVTNAGHNGGVGGKSREQSDCFSQQTKISEIKTRRSFQETPLRGGLVLATAVSPDGRYILSGGAAGKVCLTDLSSGAEIRRFEGHNQEIKGVCFSPSGIRAASGSVDQTLRIWNVETGECQHILSGHVGELTTACFSPNSQYLLSGGEDSSLRLWDAVSGDCLFTLKGHAKRITAAVFSPDGRYVASGSDDRELRIWDVNTMSCVQTFEKHGAKITATAFSQDGKYILSAGHDRHLRVWDFKSGKLEKVYRFANRIEAMNVSPDSSLVIVALADQHDPSTKNLTLLEFLSKDRYRIPYMVTLPISTSVADARDAEFEQRLAKARGFMEEGSHEAAMEALRLARSVSGYERDAEAMKLWSNLAARFPLKELKTVWEFNNYQGHTAEVEAIAFDPSLSRLLSGSRDHTLRLWEVETGQCLRILEGHTGPVRAVGMFQNGRYGVSGGSDKTLRFWDLDTGDCMRVLMEHTDEVTTLKVSEDERFALTASLDGTIKLWNLMSRICIKTFRGHTDGVTALAFSPDGHYFLSGSQDRTMRLWELISGECVRVFKGHNKKVTGVAYSPDQRYAVSVSGDMMIRKWEIESDSMPENFGGHAAGLTCLSISSDSRFALTGGEDRRLNLTELSTGKKIREFEAHAAGVTAAMVTTDRQYVVSAGKDNMVRLWQLDWEADTAVKAVWDESARPLLDIFLTNHAPFAAGGLVRKGRPHWTKDDFDDFLLELARRGFGHLKPKLVRSELKKMTRQRQASLEIVELVSDFLDGLKSLFGPIRYLIPPLVIFFKLLPAGLLAFLLWKTSFFGFPPFIGIIMVAFLALIMFAKKR